jgi:hypothetical protein
MCFLSGRTLQFVQVQQLQVAALKVASKILGFPYFFLQPYFETTTLLFIDKRK